MSPALLHEERQQRLLEPEPADVESGGIRQPLILASPYFSSRWCTLLNRTGAAVLLLPLLPALGFLMLIVKLTSRGPAIFTQTRVGQDGEHFTLYKIRTMYLDAEASTGPVWAADNDPRSTTFGRLFRHLHLDELPQVFNVLKGEMSLVGPRPERPEFTQHLAESIPDYLDRLHVKPGVTGLAQINLPADVSLECVREKVAVDLNYVQNGSLFLDLRILFCTCLKMVGLKGRRTAKLLGVRGEAGVPVGFRFFVRRKEESQAA